MTELEQTAIEVWCDCNDDQPIVDQRMDLTGPCRKLVGEVRRLSALIKAAEWASYHESLGGDEGVCPWCDFELADGVGHDASCPAFTETGVVR